MEFHISHFFEILLIWKPISYKSRGEIGDFYLRYLFFCVEVFRGGPMNDAEIITFCQSAASDFFIPPPPFGRIVCTVHVDYTALYRSSVQTLTCCTKNNSLTLIIFTNPDIYKQHYVYSIHGFWRKSGDLWWYRLFIEPIMHVNPITHYWVASGPALWNRLWTEFGIGFLAAGHPKLHIEINPHSTTAGKCVRDLNRGYKQHRIED